MRKIGFALTALLVVTGCKGKEAGTPVDRILEIGAQAEKDLADNAAKREASKDVSEMVKLGQEESAIIDSATDRINQILGGKYHRLPVALGPCTDTLPVVFGHGSIGVPDFHKGEFRINLQVSGTEKHPLPDGTFFQLVALDSAGKVLFSKDADMVDSLKVGDSLYAGGMFRATEIKGLRAVAAR
jgi:hypothetical protein